KKKNPRLDPAAGPTRPRSPPRPLLERLHALPPPPSGVPAAAAAASPRRAERVLGRRGAALQSSRRGGYPLPPPHLPRPRPPAAPARPCAARPSTSPGVPQRRRGPAPPGLPSRLASRGAGRRLASRAASHRPASLRRVVDRRRHLLPPPAPAPSIAPAQIRKFYGECTDFNIKLGPYFRQGMYRTVKNTERPAASLDQADGFENGSAGEICDNNSLDLHGYGGGGRPESSVATARHGRLAPCNNHGSSTGAHGALWNSSSRRMVLITSELVC
ncbi:hypothetical protein U9M48_041815, partial [Paspalum notatum var. saurae]